MGETTAIAWTDRTFNGWIGCERVSPGCQHCYAEQLDKRVGGYGRRVDAEGRPVLNWGKHAPRYRTSEANWREPLRWDAAAAKAGRPTLVFCSSLADVFEDRAELAPWREDLFELIERTPNLIWQLLTKRPQNVLGMVPVRWLEIVRLRRTWPSNVWIGTTVEDQQRADERLPELLRIPAPVRFLSCEPLLGPVDIDEWLCDSLFTSRKGIEGFYPALDWVIVGGESGPGHRPLDLAHAGSLVEQCERAGVPVFFKQVGGRTPAAGGDVLDGRRIKQFPREACRG